MSSCPPEPVGKTLSGICLQWPSDPKCFVFPLSRTPGRHFDKPRIFLFFELGQTPLEEPAFGGLARKFQRLRVRPARLDPVAEAPAQVGPSRVRQMVVDQLTAAQDRIDRGQAG